MPVAPAPRPWKVTVGADVQPEPDVTIVTDATAPPESTTAPVGSSEQPPPAKVTVVPQIHRQSGPPPVQPHLPMSHDEKGLGLGDRVTGMYDQSITGLRVHDIIAAAVLD